MHAHEGGFLTRYANLGEVKVSLGDAVNKGDTIALAGSSGNAAKAKLHFELRHNGTQPSSAKSSVCPAL